MLRSLPIVLFLLAIVPTAHAQVAPGCTQANPCAVTVDVDAVGIADLSSSTFTSGDWVVFSVYNDDEQTHTLRLAGHPLDLMVAGGDLVDSQAFKLGAAGTYALSDQPSGDAADITVEAEETFSSSGSADGNSRGNGIPGPAPVLVLGLLAAMAWVRRK